MRKIRNFIVTIITLVGICVNANAISVSYTSMGVPNVDTSFKTYMSYKCITNKTSPQYKFINKWGWSDCEGFMRCNGERDLGISDDYYLIALGSYYGTKIGTKYRITTDKGKVIYGVLSDCKANAHTNSTHQYTLKNKDIIEFLVNTKLLNSKVKLTGSAGAYSPLEGKVIKVEKINFN